MQKQCIRRFATRVSPPDARNPGPYSGRIPLSTNQLGKARLPTHHGFLGHGKKLRNNYKRRWRGGRYNYFDWNTVLQCINFCPSVIERDRMPSPRELNHYYRGAQIGVRHHGGFYVVANILNLEPYRPYRISTVEYPSWIEEEWIEKKMNDETSTASPHKWSIPDYLATNPDTVQRIKNIRGKTLTNRDKQDIIRKIYKKINVHDYEDDVERRTAIKKEFDLHKAKVRNDIILQEYNLGLLPYGIYQNRSDGNLRRKEIFVDKKLQSTNDQHVLLQDKSQHIDTEEKRVIKGKKPSRLKALREKFSRRKKEKTDTL